MLPSFEDPLASFHQSLDMLQLALDRCPLLRF
jgi:hypothetical protein